MVLFELPSAVLSSITFPQRVLPTCVHLGQYGTSIHVTTCSGIHCNEILTIRGSAISREMPTPHET